MLHKNAGMRFAVNSATARRWLIRNSRPTQIGDLVAVTAARADLAGPPLKVACGAKPEAADLAIEFPLSAPKADISEASPLTVSISLCNIGPDAWLRAGAWVDPLN